MTHTVTKTADKMFKNSTDSKLSQLHPASHHYWPTTMFHCLVPTKKY